LDVHFVRSIWYICAAWDIRSSCFVWRGVRRLFELCVDNLLLLIM
jgi:hypothetical protein